MLLGIMFVVTVLAFTVGVKAVCLYYVKREIERERKQKENLVQSCVLEQTHNLNQDGE